MKELLDIMMKLKQAGYTVLPVGHDMKLVMNIYGRIYMLDSGVLIADGVSEKIRSSQVVTEAYLGKED